MKKENGHYILVDKVDNVAEKAGELKTVFKDGKLIVDDSLAAIRKRLFEK